MSEFNSISKKQWPADTKREPKDTEKEPKDNNNKRKSQEDIERRILTQYIKKAFQENNGLKTQKKDQKIIKESLKTKKEPKKKDFIKQEKSKKVYKSPVLKNKNLLSVIFDLVGSDDIKPSLININKSFRNVMLERHVSVFFLLVKQ